MRSVQYGKAYQCIPRRGKAKVFGAAFTVHMVLQSDATAPTPTSHFVDTIPKDSVIYTSQPKGTFNSVWGGLMSTTAQVLGAQGIVADGYFRDINEHRDLNFPVNFGLPARNYTLTRGKLFA